MSHPPTDTRDPRLPRVSIVIPTFDEEVHVARAVRSGLALGPVFVVDSESADRTRTIARESGATVVEHAWEGYAAQKNWALDNLDFHTEWVFILDADEVLTPALCEEVRQLAEAADRPGYYVAREYFFLGRHLRHAWHYPDFQLRLFRLGHARYEDRIVHEHIILDGEPGFLRAPLLHENLKGMGDFLDRHVRYAALEANQILDRRADPASDNRTGSFVGTWPERRRALKDRVWHKLRARFVLRFLWMYVIKRGFLDGREGRLYCQLIAAYEGMIEAELYNTELSRGLRRPTSAPVTEMDDRALR